MMRVLVTGATGFVGGEVCRVLSARGWQVRMALRTPRSGLPDYERVLVGEIGPQTDWSAALAGVDAVLHLAARVHVMRELAADPDAAFALVNTQGSERLAWESARAGVGRLVYVSSLKVNGESTQGRPFDELDPPRPADPYARSKAAAELALERVAASSGLETVVVRPPLVYGPGVGGNLRRILGAIDRGLPLPLAAIDNRRSLVGVWGLADLLARCIEHPAAAGQTFLAAETPDLSTPELIRALAAGLCKPARLWSVPPRMLGWIAAAAGMRPELERLCGSLQASGDKARGLLGWSPPVQLREGLERTAAAFVQGRAGAAIPGGSGRR
jgi:nucleoside-diphosphate-sugar epimerase